MANKYLSTVTDKGWGGYHEFDQRKSSNLMAELPENFAKVTKGFETPVNRRTSI